MVHYQINAMKYISQRYKLASCRTTTMKRLLSTESDACNPIRCAIVGSGPAGYYAAKYLLEKNPLITIDMIEKLPTPYGLVRQGVAPDHQEVKSVMATFTEVASNSRYRFFGNVLVDDGNSKENTVSIHEIKEAYDIVVLAYGASSDKSLNVVGEDLKGVLSARNFVNWYNSHPDYIHIGNEFDLSKTRKVAIIGQGNVAIDCARILMKSIEELEQTDISTHALNQLKTSIVDEIIIIGRRGHIQASFTIKEIRELTKLTNVNVNILQSEIDAGLTESSKSELSNNRSKTRIIELLNKIAVETTKRVISETDKIEDSKDINLRFLLSPIEILAREDDDSDRVGGIVIERNELIGDENKQKAIAVEGSREIMKCDLILKSVGYKSDELKGIPFDHHKNIIPNLRGRVLNTDQKNENLEIKDSDVSGEYLAGVYVTGWLKRGPSGIIGTNITDARETVECILEDIQDMKHFKSDIKYDNENYDNSKYDPVDLIKGLSNSDVISWRDYLEIEEEEELRGLLSVPPKPREKMYDIKEFLSIARRARNIAN